MNEAEVRVDCHYQVDVGHSRPDHALSHWLADGSSALSQLRKQVDCTLVDINDAVIYRQCRQPRRVVEALVFRSWCIPSIRHICTFSSYLRGGKLVLQVTRDCADVDQLLFDIC